MAPFARLLAALSLLVLFFARKFWDLVFENVLVQLFGSDARGLLRVRIVDQWRRAGHELACAASGNDNVRKLAFGSFALDAHLKFSFRTTLEAAPRGRGTCGATRRAILAACRKRASRIRAHIRETRRARPWRRTRLPSQNHSIFRCSPSCGGAAWCARRRASSGAVRAGAARESIFPTPMAPIRSARAARLPFPSSFDVLHLLAEFFNFSFDLKSQSGNREALAFHTGRLGEQSVRLAVHFLEQEIELLADFAAL